MNPFTIITKLEGIVTPVKVGNDPNCFDKVDKLAYSSCIMTKYI